MKLSLACTLVAAAVLAATASGGSGKATCPATAPASTTATAEPAAGPLVPTGASALLLCRYRGLNPASTAHRLDGSRDVTGEAELKRLTGEFDALPKASLMFHCPMDDGSEITGRFTYPHGAAVLLTVGLTGCRTVTNGRIVRSAAGSGGSALIEQLTALVA